MNSTANPLISALITLIVAGIIYWIGSLIITALGLPAIFTTILLVVVVLFVLFYLLKLFGIYSW